MQKTGYLTILGALGGMAAAALGGWDHGLQTLVIFMAADFITGWVVAGVFHRSPKTESGALGSGVGLKGICKKAVMLLLVLVAARMDLVLGSDYLRNAVVIALVANELVSLIENAGLMGIPIPPPLRRAIDVLTKNTESEGR